MAIISQAYGMGGKGGLHAMEEMGSLTGFCLYCGELPLTRARAKE
jgi:hypothetical protein